MFSKQHVASHNTRDNAWIVINDKIYDVTNFAEKHPGGDFIYSHLGNDCTTLFYSNHTLRTIENLEKMPGPQAFIGMLDKNTSDEYFDKYYNVYPNDWTEYFSLKKQVDNYFTENKIAKSGNLQGYLEILTVLVMFWLTFFNFFIRGGSILWFVAHIQFRLMVIFTIAHTSGHSAISNKWWVNNIIARCLWLLAGNIEHFKFNHNVNHHSVTNTDNDNDGHLALCYIETHKEFFNRNCITKACVLPTYIFIGAVNHYMLPNWEYIKTHNRSFILPFITINITQAMFLHVSTLDPISYISYFMLMGILQMTIGVIIGNMNHHQFETVSNTKDNWMRNQVSTAINVAQGSRIVNVLLGGGNHHIEHHLFPAISHVHYPAISTIVRDFCKEHDIRYKTTNNIFLLAKNYIRFIYSHIE